MLGIGGRILRTRGMKLVRVVTGVARGGEVGGVMCR